MAEQAPVRKDIFPTVSAVTETRVDLSIQPGDPAGTDLGDDLDQNGDTGCTLRSSGRFPSDP
jgi:hypothetical protein